MIWREEDEDVRNNNKKKIRKNQTDKTAKFTRMPGKEEGDQELEIEILWNSWCTDEGVFYRIMVLY